MSDLRTKGAASLSSPPLTPMQRCFMKTCTKCKEKKDLSEYYADKRNKDGRQARCKLCHNLEAKEHYQNNKEEIKRSFKQWRKENRGKSNSIKAKYRAAKAQRTPNWLTCDQLEYIRNEYLMAVKLEAITGDKYHVDHVVPLQGNDVSGLHVPWNLQILEAKDNLSKSNKHG